MRLLLEPEAYCDACCGAAMGVSIWWGADADAPDSILCASCAVALVDALAALVPMQVRFEERDR